MNALAKLIQKTLDEHKAEDIEVIDVSKRTPFATWYVLATCPNPRSLGAIAEETIEAVETKKHIVKAVDGKAETGWIIISCEDVMVHLFLQSKRSEINLEEIIGKTAK